MAKIMYMDKTFAGVASDLNYSLQEKAVGKWVDGKTIFKKTVAFGALPNASQKLVAHGIPNLGYVVKIEGTCLQGTSYKDIPLMYKGSDSAYNVEFSITPTNISVTASQDRSMVVCAYVTIYYTKTS